MNFESLEVWRRSAALAADVYKALAGLKDFGFKDQITRSCLSISSNIAEGSERSTPNDRQHFLTIAKGSTAEFISQVYIGRKIGYINQEDGKYWQSEAQQIAAMLASLKKKWSAVPN
ncbi:four helix bundle protein [Porticoccus sp. GXU_MW_L64]